MRRVVAVVVLGLLVPAPLHAQERRAREEALPRKAAREVVAFFNAPGTIRLEGGGQVPAGRTIRGDVAVLEGSLELVGEVDGRLVVINGDLRFREGASVRDDVTVVGGRATGIRSAAIGGSLTVHPERLRFVREGNRIRRARPVPRRDRAPSSSLDFGRVRFTVRAGTNYNRVEGLPVMFGPIVETGSPNPFRLEALAVWRTDEGFDLDADEMGYRVRIEQSLGDDDFLSVGATAHSLVEPLERWTLTDLESSLAAFLFHKDYRDYVETTGWSAYLRVEPPGAPLELGLDFRDDDHAFLSAGSPWTLKDNGARWRPQPLVAEGELRTVGAMLTLDTRNDPEDPSHGWWIRARARAGVGGEAEIPAHAVPWTTPGEPPGAELVEVPARPADTDFTTGFLDVRRYNRVSPSSALVLRGVLGGSLDGEPLPPQFQHAPGGEGSLPGFPLFSVDCGARSRVVAVSGLADDEGHPIPAHPAYGCDRMALFQAELRGGFPWDVEWGDDREEWSRRHREWEWDEVDFDPGWMVFFDAGRGWSRGAGSAPAHDAFDEETRLDAGAGLRLGDVGLYLAVPLTGQVDGVNFFIRLDHRF